jgi:hypothetical protein
VVIGAVGCASEPDGDPATGSGPPTTDGDPATSSGPPTTDGDGDVRVGVMTAALARTPVESVGDGVAYLITIADLDAVAGATGHDRASGAAEVAWARSLALPDSAVPVRPFDLLGRSMIDGEGVEQAYGFALSDVDTFVEVAAPPIKTAVLSGDLTLAPAAAPTGIEGVVTFGEGDDHAPNPDAMSPVNPIGTPVRAAQRDGSTILSTSTDAASAWLAGGESLADDDALARVAAALDTAGAISAVVERGGFRRPLAIDRTAPPSDITVPAPTGIVPFDVVGVGWTGDAESPIVVVYSFPNAAAASGSVAGLEVAYAERSVIFDRPIPDVVELVSIEASGSTVVALLRPAGGFGASEIVGMIRGRDAPFGY